MSDITPGECVAGNPARFIHSEEALFKEYRC